MNAEQLKQRNDTFLVAVRKLAEEPARSDQPGISVRRPDSGLATLEIVFPDTRVWTNPPDESGRSMVSVTSTRPIRLDNVLVGELADVAAKLREALSENPGFSFGMVISDNRNHLRGYPRDMREIPGFRIVAKKRNGYNGFDFVPGRDFPWNGIEKKPADSTKGDASNVVRGALLEAVIARIREHVDSFMA
ncbi:MAG: hypothetical protein UV80_C0002G0046 [Candidatus Peregrinibacteria bacterium GW2011_GWF2_43_17]|nr:MAG: hypothetical protein UV80_C0002G0046 [Candidatus Peregrinibacteria bacterium GW2011_GWF2_43_17]KKT20575.1 MAG: hypothetical protein UW03_C0002G0041 [Candidatus Peregrinibacteria bacterium GW2011_GWA2_43_8]HAU39907.1 hypothetical protein [Candidatus Peregrinibacteria bacterium]